jgi:hypothetical protein
MENFILSKIVSFFKKKLVAQKLTDEQLETTKIILMYNYIRLIVDYSLVLYSMGISVEALSFISAGTDKMWAEVKTREQKQQFNKIVSPLKDEFKQK